MDVRAENNSARSVIWDGFYERLNRDFLLNGKRSVIYGYYRDEVKKKIESVRAGNENKSKKMIDIIISEHISAVDNSDADSTYDFARRFIGYITETPELYNYPCRLHDQKNDLAEICNVVKPFVLEEKLREKIDAFISEANNIDDEKNEEDEIEDDNDDEIDNDEKDDDNKKKKDNKDITIKKTELDKALKDTLGAMEKTRIDIDPADLDALVKHVIDRIIFKSFDDYLYNAGYKVESSSKDTDIAETDKAVCERVVKGRKKAKADKTLELIYRYYLNTGKLPFGAAADIEDDEYAGMCTSLYWYLNTLFANKKEIQISVPLAADELTGCSLQIIGNKYYTRDDLDEYSPLAYAVFGRNVDDSGSYIYEFYSDLDAGDAAARLFTDFDIACEEYAQCKALAGDEIRRENASFFGPQEKKDGIPGRFMPFFEADDLSESEAYADTVDDIKRFYDDEEDDEEFIPKLSV